MTHSIIIILCLVSLVFPQNIEDFPLWGSAWIVAQGNNKKVFTSALPLRPEKLAIIHFSSIQSIKISYANLSHRLYRCTAELVEDIKHQIERNRVVVPIDSTDIINIAYQPFNDTIWSGDRDLVERPWKYRGVGRRAGNTDSLFEYYELNRLRNHSVFFRTKPIYYGRRYATYEDEKLYSIASTDDDGETIFLQNDKYINEKNTWGKQDVQGIGYVDLQSLKKEPVFVNYRKGDYVYEYIPCKLQFKTASIGYWQVHIHPQVWYYPRDPFNGQGVISDELKMNPQQAQEKRSASLGDPDNLDLKYYRNPFLSDSASVIISFAFCEIPNTNMARLNSISLADSVVQINHYPPAMYRVSSYSDPATWSNYRESLYMLYSKDSTDEIFNSRIDARCIAWEYKDLKNADLIFPPKLQVPGSLVRDRNVDDGLLTYNGCPCNQIRELKNLTPVQLRRLVFLTAPMCDRNEMIKVVNLYDAFFPYLKNKNDQNLIIQKRASMVKVIQERDVRAAKAGADWSAKNERCPDTWADFF